MRALTSSVPCSCLASATAKAAAAAGRGWCLSGLVALSAVRARRSSGASQTPSSPDGAMLDRHRATRNAE
eukprot:6210863-Pyramimonas_sp.AAC.1